VVIRKGDQVLHAEEATYRQKTGMVSVRGNVRLEAGGDVLRGDSGWFDLNRQVGRIEGGRLFLARNHYYVRGDLVEKTGPDTYRVRNCVVTTCDGPVPAWSISGSEVEVTLEGYGHVTHAAFRVRDWPVLYFPYMVFPAKTKRQTGFLPPRAGYSTRNGVEGELPFFWAVSDQVDATFYPHYMSRRGYEQGVELRYRQGEESGGVFLFDLLQDRKDKDMTDEDDLAISPYKRTNRTRYWFRGRADQEFPLGVTGHLDADLVSDQDYLRELGKDLFGFDSHADPASRSGRSLEEESSPTRRSALRLDRDGEDYSLQGLASFHQRPERPREDMTAQPLGGVYFSLLPRKWGKWPGFFRAETDYDYVWREAGSKGHRTWVAPEVTFPFWFLDDRLVAETSLLYEYNRQWVDEGRDFGNEQRSRRAYEGRANLSFQAERLFDGRWGDAERLRHKVTPSLRYRYRVHHAPEEASPWFERVDASSVVNGIVNELTFSLENALDARLRRQEKAARYARWCTFDLSQTYDLVEAQRNRGPDRRPFKPLAASLNVFPDDDLDLRGSITWNHYDKIIETSQLSMVLSVPRSGGRTDHYELDYLYAVEDEKTLSFSADIFLLWGFSAGMALSRDLRLGKDISRSLRLGYNSQCWGIDFVVEKQYRETRFLVVFDLLGLGEFKGGRKKSSLVRYWRRD